MPEKDPNLWAGILAALSSPSIQGMVMAVIVAFLRVLYDDKETSKVRILLESLICGALSLSASSFIGWMDWPPSLSVGVGGMIGFLGVTAIRGFIVKFVGKKVEGP